jgi:ferredoxin
MGAIYIERRRAYVNQDECVECGNCQRFLTPENISPFLTRLFRRILAFLRLRYDQPIDICPTGALYQPKLEWPRIVRAYFSDPTTTHPATQMRGRGTEEIKTNDVTGRLKPGEAGILVEFGRPGIGARFTDVQKITTALARLPIRFEEKNPITHLMKDRQSGLLDPSILEEKVLSCILEVIMPLEVVPEALRTIREVLPSLNTVVSLVINGRCGPEGEVLYETQVLQAGFQLSPNGKTNLGLGRPTEEKETPQMAATGG